MFLLVIVMVKHLIVVDIAGLEPRLISEDRTPNICSLSAKGELSRVPTSISRSYLHFTG